MHRQIASILLYLFSISITCELLFIIMTSINFVYYWSTSGPVTIFNLPRIQPFLIRQLKTFSNRILKETIFGSYVCHSSKWQV